MSIGEPAGDFEYMGGSLEGEPLEEFELPTENEL